MKQALEEESHQLHPRVVTTSTGGLVVKGHLQSPQTRLSKFKAARSPQRAVCWGEGEDLLAKERRTVSSVKVSKDSWLSPLRKIINFTGW